MRQLDPVEQALCSVGQNVEDAARIDANIADAPELVHRQLGAGLLAVYGDRAARIVDAERGDGPTVIAAAMNQVELVAALRPVLVGP